MDELLAELVRERFGPSVREHRTAAPRRRWTPVPVDPAVLAERWRVLCGEDPDEQLAARRRRDRDLSGVITSYSRGQEAV